MRSRHLAKNLVKWLGPCLLLLAADHFGSIQLFASSFANGVSQGTVTAPAIVEASGLIASPDNPGVLWTENDSNNPNTIYALDTSGHLLGTYTLTGAVNTDWEDISIGPGPEPGVNYIYLANSATGSSSVLVRVPEPTVYASQQVGSPVTKSITGSQTQTFLWPAADAEAMFVDRQNGDIYFGSKEAGHSNFYRATQAQFTGSGTPSATFAATVGLDTANGASISPDGKQILVRNQSTQGKLFHRTAGQSISQALASTADAIPLKIEPNPEAITFDSDGVDYFTISEGSNPSLYKYVRTSNDGPARHVSLVSPAANWKYLDGGVAPAAGWTQAGFNDSGWSTNSGPFGYGQGQEHTVLSFGGNAANKPASDVFRTTFNVTNPHLLTAVNLMLLVDDGARVYLNGTEIYRFNLSASATLTTFATAQVSTALRNSWRSFTIDRDLLSAGINTLAVDVHGFSGSDATLRFDLQINALPVVPVARRFQFGRRSDRRRHSGDARSADGG